MVSAFQRGNLNFIASETRFNILLPVAFWFLLFSQTVQEEAFLLQRYGPTLPKFARHVLVRKRGARPICRLRCLPPTSTATSPTVIFDTTNILAALRGALLPLNTRKPAGRLPGEECRGFTLGLSLGYGRGVCLPTAATREWPELARVLCAACVEACPDFRFTSIQVNRNTKYMMHTDGVDAGASRMICCGNFTRGRMWLHDSQAGSWSAIDAHDKWIAFDGRELHLTEEWDGPERYSLVYFTNQVFGGASRSKTGKETKSFLEELGFPWPSQADAFKVRLPAEQDRRISATAALPDHLREEALLSTAMYMQAKRVY